MSSIFKKKSGSGISSHNRNLSYPVAIAQFSLVASTPQELSFSRGDRILIISESYKGNDSIWYGIHEKERKTGHFPKKRVHLTEEHVLYDSSKSNQDEAFNAKALMTHNAKEEGEISFQRGDTIIVSAKLYKGQRTYWFGENPKGEKGGFPAAKVKVIKHNKPPIDPHSSNRRHTASPSPATSTRSARVSRRISSVIGKVKKGSSSTRPTVDPAPEDSIKIAIKSYTPSSTATSHITIYTGDKVRLAKQRHQSNEKVDLDTIIQGTNLSSNVSGSFPRYVVFPESANSQSSSNKFRRSFSPLHRNRSAEPSEPVTNSSSSLAPPLSSSPTLKNGRRSSATFLRPFSKKPEEDNSSSESSTKAPTSLRSVIKKRRSSAHSQPSSLVTSGSSPLSKSSENENKDFSDPQYSNNRFLKNAKGANKKPRKAVRRKKGQMTQHYKPQGPGEIEIPHGKVVEIITLFYPGKPNYCKIEYQGKTGIIPKSAINVLKSDRTISAIKTTRNGLFSTVRLAGELQESAEIDFVSRKDVWSDYDRRKKNEEVVFSAETECLTGISYNRMIQLLLLSDFDFCKGSQLQSNVEKHFLKVFLTSYRCFTTPVTLMKKFYEGMDPPYGSGVDRTVISQNVGRILLSLASTPEFASSGASKAMKNTLKRLSDSGPVQARNILTALDSTANLWQTSVSNSSQSSQRSRSQKSSPLSSPHTSPRSSKAQSPTPSSTSTTTTPKIKIDSLTFVPHTLDASFGYKIAYPMSKKVPKVITSHKGRKHFTYLPTWKSILDVPEQELARQIAIRNFVQFAKIRPSELLAQAWAKREGRQRSPNVLSMVDNSNQLGGFVASSIIHPETASARAEILTFWIRVGDHLLHLQDYAGLMALSSGLQHIGVYRLFDTWERLTKHKKATWHSISHATDTDHNFRSIRAHLEEAMKNPPAVPFIGSWLTDLTFVDDGNETCVGNLINWTKVTTTYNLVEKLLSMQRTGYYFIRLESVQKLLDEMTFQDEDTLYNLSVEREPLRPIGGISDEDDDDDD